MHSRVAQVGIFALPVEEVLVVCPKALMDVHAGAVILEDRLGHEGNGFAVTDGHIFCHVLIFHHVVGHLRQGIELQVDFRLPRGPYFVVMDFDVHTQSLEG